MDLEFLPAFNAGLNTIAAVLLVMGLVRIRRGQVTAHRNTMLTALGVSVLFLACYVLHKAWKASVGLPVNSTYHGEGWAKGVYLLILFTHLVLAMTVPVFAAVLVWAGLTRRYRLHRRVARVGWPIWMYVSVTGVVIYVMLYHFNPG